MKKRALNRRRLEPEMEKKIPLVFSKRASSDLFDASLYLLLTSNATALFII